MEMVFLEPRCRRTPRWNPWSDIIDIDGAVWDAFFRRHRSAPKRRPCGDRPTPSSKRSCCQQRNTPETEEQPFRVSLNAAGFRPDDVTIRQSDGVVTVNAHSSADGITRHMFHKLRLPDNSQRSGVTAHLSRSGQLVLEAPLVVRPPLSLPQTDQQIPVSHEEAAGKIDMRRAITKAVEMASNDTGGEDGCSGQLETSEEEKTAENQPTPTDVMEKMAEVQIIDTKASSSTATEHCSVTEDVTLTDVAEHASAANADGEGQASAEDSQERVTPSSQKHSCEDLCLEADDGDSAAGDAAVVVPVVSEPSKDSDVYRVTSDVSSFQPHEVSVKVAGRVVTVQAEREQSFGEAGSSSLRMVRSFTLPEGVDPDQVTSRLTPSRQLVIEAPQKVAVGCTSAAKM